MTRQCSEVPRGTRQCSEVPRVTVRCEGLMELCAENEKTLLALACGALGFKVRLGCYVGEPVVS